MRLKQAVVEGKVVRVGNFVGFKIDVEQGGEITDIEMNDWGREILTIWNPDGFNGCRFPGETTVSLPASDCWNIGPFC
jgi:hypothetical protein